jgi:hypothetical protein
MEELELFKPVRRKARQSQRHGPITACAAVAVPARLVSAGQLIMRQVAARA